MILENQFILVTINKKNLEWYFSKGYEVNLRDKVYVLAKDLIKGSHDEILVQCDYCKNIFPKVYKTYVQQNEKAIIHKDCCKACAQRKVEESNLMIYGVTSTGSVQEFIEKRIQTNIERYGGTSYLSSEEGMKKFKQTLIDRYGYDHLSKIPQFQEKKAQNNLDKYGVTNPLLNEQIKKEYQSKNIEKWGCINPSSNEDVKTKRIQTFQSRYNVKNPSQIQEVKDKIKTTNIRRYGKPIPLQTEECQNKLKNTMKERYGVENYSQTKDYKVKYKNTCLNRYGVEHKRKIPQVAEEAIRVLHETMNKNGSMPVSKGQSYLHSILGGIVNYPIGNINLDIAFPEDKIYVEYDGGGHKLNVILGQITEEEFNEKEKRRNYLLKNMGWKLIRIIATTEYVPTPLKIKEMFNIALSVFNDNHSWINFNIDEKYIITSYFTEKFDYGDLTRTDNLKY
jgi:hypothetical protein